jgi:peptidylprolyl isomerase/FKBP-type peptidyl-prolyl cis-trans isomerase FkpA
MRPEGAFEMTSRTLSALAFVLVAGIAFADGNAPCKPTGKPFVFPSGLKSYDLKKGFGADAKRGDVLRVQYTGWLTNGKKFDSSYEHEEPFEFTLGTKQVIKGWDEGIVGLRVGGKRQLLVPSRMAYGDAGFSDLIPPNSDLVFEIELLSVNL